MSFWNQYFFAAYRTKSERLKAERHLKSLCKEIKALGDDANTYVGPRGEAGEFVVTAPFTNLARKLGFEWKEPFYWDPDGDVTTMTNLFSDNTIALVVRDAGSLGRGDDWRNFCFATGAIMFGGPDEFELAVDLPDAENVVQQLIEIGKIAGRKPSEVVFDDSPMHWSLRLRFEAGQPKRVVRISAADSQFFSDIFTELLDSQPRLRFLDGTKVLETEGSSSDALAGLRLLLEGEPLPEGKSTGLPVERLASALGKLPSDPSYLPEALVLFGDGLSAALLYRLHPDLVLERLSRALSGLPAAKRWALVEASLWMRPLKEAHVAPYVAMTLDALGIDGNAPPPEKQDEKLILYRWSNVLLVTTFAMLHALREVFEERRFAAGVENRDSASEVFGVFQDWLQLRASYLVTTRQCPSALRLVREMQHRTWEDMPWLLGTRGGTFSIDPNEPSSTEAERKDAAKVMETLWMQTLPQADFYVGSYAWYAGATVETIRDEADKRGVVLLPLDAAELVDTRKLREAEMSPTSRALWIEGTQALEDVHDELPAEVSLAFFDVGEGQVGAFELALPQVELTDARLLTRPKGDKTIVRFYFKDHPTAIVRTLSSSRKDLNVLRIPLAIAEVWPHCTRVRVQNTGPKAQFKTNAVSLFRDIDAETIALWRE